MRRWPLAAALQPGAGGVLPGYLGGAAGGRLRGIAITSALLLHAACFATLVFYMPGATPRDLPQEPVVELAVVQEPPPLLERQAPEPPAAAPAQNEAAAVSEPPPSVADPTPPVADPVPAETQPLPAETTPPDAPAPVAVAPVAVAPVAVAEPGPVAAVAPAAPSRVASPRAAPARPVAMPRRAVPSRPARTAQSDSPPSPVLALPGTAVAAPVTPAAMPSDITSGIGPYRAGLHQQIERNMEIDPEIEAMGVAVIEAVIAPDGHVLAARIARSSGNRLIDKAAVTAVQKGGYRPFGAHMPAAPITISVPIEITPG